MTRSVNLNEILIKETMTIKDAIAHIDSGGAEIAIVIDEEQRIIGTITDGDVRRGILRGMSLDDPAKTIMFRHPRVATMSTPRAELIETMQRLSIRQMPLVDTMGRVLDVVALSQLQRRATYSNNVVLMAGGMGVRMRPFTTKTPKPMLKVGGKPILESIIETFKRQGFSNFIISVNYLAEQVMDHFGDGNTLGVSIRYVHESKRLGTAGCLSLIEKPVTEPFFVMNGDILTEADFENMLKYHNESGATATMALNRYRYEIPFGVVKLNERGIVDIEEKPNQEFFVNAGIYILSHETLPLIPHNEYLDMPDLFKVLHGKNMPTTGFPMWEYWLDVGRPHDLRQAEDDLVEHPRRLDAAS